MFVVFSRENEREREKGKGSAGKEGILAVFVHNPYGFPPDDEEAILLHAAVAFFDGYPGSIPSERVQSFVRIHYPVPYDNVVNQLHRGHWRAFVFSYPGQLALIAIDEEERKPWRIRLAGSHRWRDVDATQQGQRHGEDQRVCDQMERLMLGFGGTVTLRQLTDCVNAAAAGRYLRMRHARHLLQSDRRGRFAVDHSSALVRLTGGGRPEQRSAIRGAAEGQPEVATEAAEHGIHVRTDVVSEGL